VSYLIHTPLWELDRVTTGRHTTIGKWRGMKEEIGMRERLVWFPVSALVGAVAMFVGFWLLRPARLHRFEY
jgi:hypothetical protein